MTKGKKTSLVLGIIVILAAGITALVENIQTQQYSTVTNPTTVTSTSTVTTSTTTTTTASTISSSTTSGSGTYTLADVAQHNSAASCWTAINGGVYDVTTWINQHPGGPDHILSLCGTDGSAAFNGQHGGQSQPAEILATFKIGTLAQ